MVHEREAAALESLVGVGADLEYLETEATLEGALTLLATASADQCINQIVATRLRHGSIMTSTPSTRRLLDGAAHPTHWLISAQNVTISFLPNMRSQILLKACARGARRAWLAVVPTDEV